MNELEQIKLELQEGVWDTLKNTAKNFYSGAKEKLTPLAQRVGASLKSTFTGKDPTAYSKIEMERNAALAELSAALNAKITSVEDLKNAKIKGLSLDAKALLIQFIKNYDEMLNVARTVENIPSNEPQQPENDPQQKQIASQNALYDKIKKLANGFSVKFKKTLEASKTPVVHKGLTLKEYLELYETPISPSTPVNPSTSKKTVKKPAAKKTVNTPKRKSLTPQRSTQKTPPPQQNIYTILNDSYTKFLTELKNIFYTHLKINPPSSDPNLIDILNNEKFSALSNEQKVKLKKFIVYYANQLKKVKPKKP